ncbi:MAG: hypothetical protein U9O59_05930, partial [Actinomycetota bacterium]|nr:hypothetical protein [Actinomycetota bacterium]
MSHSLEGIIKKALVFLTITALLFFLIPESIVFGSSDEDLKAAYINALAAVENSENEAGEARNLLDSAEQALAEAEANLEPAEQELLLAEESCSSAKQEAEKLEEELSFAQAAADEANSFYERIKETGNEQEISEAKEAADSANAELELAAAEYESATSDLEVLKGEMDEAEAEYNKLKAIYDEAEAEFQYAVENLDEKEDNLKAARKAAEEAKEELDAYQEKLDTEEEEEVLEASLAVTADAESVEPGGSITYSITVENTGSVILSDIEVLNKLPEVAVFKSSSAGEFDKNLREISYIVDELEAGEISEEEVLVSIPIGAEVSQTLTNSVIISSEEIETLESHVDVVIGSMEDEESGDGEEDEEGSGEEDEEEAGDGEDGTEEETGEETGEEEDEDGTEEETGEEEDEENDSKEIENNEIEEAQQAADEADAALEEAIAAAEAAEEALANAGEDADPEALQQELDEANADLEAAQLAADEANSLLEELKAKAEETGEDDSQQDENPLSLSVTDSPDPAAAGQTVTYTINYANNGEELLTGVVITSFLPERTTFISASGGGESRGGTAVWEIGELDAAQSGKVTVSVSIPDDSDPDAIYYNVVVIDSNETLPVSVTEDTLDPATQEFYVFGWAPDVLELLSSGGANGAYAADADDGIHSILSISNSGDTAVTAYLKNYADEDSFDYSDPASDAEVLMITIEPGEVYTVDDLIEKDYAPDSSGDWEENGSDWQLAGGDFLYVIGGAVNVVRGFAPEELENGTDGNVLAEFWNLYPTRMWDDEYTVPVGVDTYENTSSTNHGYGHDMEYTDLLIQAMEDGTTVTINDPVNGVSVITLQEGDNYLYESSGYSNVHQSATITSDKPVQAGLMTSGGKNVDTRNYNLTAGKLIGTEYYIPVDTGTGDRLYIYASEGGTVVKIYENDSDYKTINLDSDEVDSSYTMPYGENAVYIESNKPVQVLGAADSNDSDKDWGFQAISAEYYSSEYVTPYAPGKETSGSASSWPYTHANGDITEDQTTIYGGYTYNFPDSGYIKIDDEIISYTSKSGYPDYSFNGCTRGEFNTDPVWHSNYTMIYEYTLIPGDASWNPLYVTPVEDNTRVYVDWDGDGVADIPNSETSNDYVDINRYDIAKLWDAVEDDGDNGGAYIWAENISTGEPAKISVYYGEQTGADSQAGYDWGYVLIPLSAPFEYDLLLEKEANVGTAQIGNVITYTFTITSNGNTAVYDININDPKITGPYDWGTDDPSVLGEGETITATADYTASEDDLPGPIENTAIAVGSKTSGEDPDVESNEATESVALEYNALISVTKDAAPDPAEVGDVITYSYVVTNTENVTLTDLSAVDSELGAITFGETTLVPDESVTGVLTYTVTEDDLPGPITNTVNATANDPLDNPVTASDDESVELVHEASIDIVKSGTLDTGADAVANPGDVINYTFEVTNTGDVTLTNV